MVMTVKYHEECLSKGRADRKVEVRSVSAQRKKKRSSNAMIKIDKVGKDLLRKNKQTTKAGRAQVK